MNEAPERIWIESDGECPYYYHEEELFDVAPPITEYVRADKMDELAAETEALRTEVERLEAENERLREGGRAMREVQAYADAQLRKEPPVQCDLKVGDRVTYTNEYGVSFPSMLVIGFAHDDSFYGRFIHLAGPDHPGAYWFPLRRDELAKEEDND